MRAVEEVVGTARHLPFIWHFVVGQEALLPHSSCGYTSYVCVTRKRKPGIDLQL